jgi:aminopeptidase
MFEDFAPKLAKVLTEYSSPIRKGDVVGIWGTIHAIPLIEALYAAALRRGGQPYAQLHLPALEDILLREGSEEQLAFAPPVSMADIEGADVRFGIMSPANGKSTASADPQRLAQRTQAWGPVNTTYKERSGSGALRWATTTWPTEGMAQDADMSLLDFTEFLYKACALDQADPVAYWEAIGDRQARLIEWLKGAQQVRVCGPGIDLTLEVAGRPWINADGHQNFPDGEILTAPVEESANGHVAFSFPSGPVSGVRLAFRDGVVVEASAEKGEKHLLAQLEVDEGARRIGIFGIGTNPGIQRYVGGVGITDIKMAGTMHLALGHSFPETGGKNKSALYWLMLHDLRDGGEIWVDGKLFCRGGTFMVG